MENKFSEQDSLKLINEMISQAKSNIQIGAADAMLRSGYCVIAISILNIILLYTLPCHQMSYWLWALMIPVSIIGWFIDRKKDRSAIVKTHIDKIISSVWIAFRWSVCLLLFFILGISFMTNTWMLAILIMPVILTLMGFAQYVSAIASKFQPFLRAAFIFWIGAVACVALLFVTKEHYASGQFIILIVCTITGFCIPGHSLNKLAEKQHV